MNNDFISEDDLLTFEGWLKYHAIDPATLTPEELAMWRGYFDEATQRRESSPKVGLMKLRSVPGEQKYSVAVRDGSKLWLTMWVRCSAKGIYMSYTLMLMPEMHTPAITATGPIIIKVMALLTFQKSVSR